MNTVLLVDAIKGSSRKVLLALSWVFIAWSWALQVQSSLGQGRCGLAKGITAGFVPLMWRRPPCVKAGAGRAMLGISERMSCVGSLASCLGNGGSAEDGEALPSLRATGFHGVL